MGGAVPRPGGVPGAAADATPPDQKTPPPPPPPPCHASQASARTSAWRRHPSGHPPPSRVLLGRRGHPPLPDRAGPVGHVHPRVAVRDLRGHPALNQEPSHRAPPLKSLSCAQRYVRPANAGPRPTTGNAAAPLLVPAKRPRPGWRVVPHPPGFPGQRPIDRARRHTEPLGDRPLGFTGPSTPGTRPGSPWSASPADAAHPAKRP